MILQKKKIAAAFIAAAVTMTTFSGVGGLLNNRMPGETEARAATDPYGTPYDPVTADPNDTVIVVDPGHGGSDSGAVGNGYKEKDLNLDIASALSERLSQYRNVRVYMTRSEDYYVGLTARTDYAASVKADAFVSVHLNSAGASAHGAEVWYPNASYDSKAHSKGAEMAENVLDGLIDLGLFSRNFHSKNSSAGSKYPDGSIADYYAVIRGSKLHHIPGIIIEGAFISSKSDVKNFLNSDDKTEAMGIADADAIAKSFDLTLSDGSEQLPGVTTLTFAAHTGEANKVKISWKQAANASEYLVFRKTGAKGSYKEIGRTAGTEYTDETGSYGKTYYYTVIARNNYGRPDSYDKKGLKVTIPKKDLEAKSAVDNGLGRVKVTWEKDPNATGYRVYRKTTGSFKKVTTIQHNSTTYTDETVAKNTSYTYCVKAYYKMNGSTIWSTYKSPGVSVTTDSDPIGTLTGSAAADNKSISFSWDKSADPDVTYRIYRKAGEGSYERVFQAAPGAELKYTDTDLLAGTTYSYRLRFFRKGLHDTKKTFWSSYSNVVTFTTPQEETPSENTETTSQGTSMSANVTAPVDPAETSASVSAYMSSLSVQWRSAYTPVRSSGDRTDYDADEKDYVTPASETSLALHWTPVNDVSGYQILDGNGKRITSVSGADRNSYTAKGLKKRTTYTYMIRPFRRFNGKNYFGNRSTPASGTTAYAVKGASSAQPAQMARYYNSKVSSRNFTYPSDVYSSYGAPSIDDFTRIVYEEATRAGIKSEVLFGQICKETGFLKFGGDVSAAQCNFGGIGATGGGNPGIDFVRYASLYYSALGYDSPEAAAADAVRVGIRAQAVHLGLYASNDGKAPSFSHVTAVEDYPNIGTVVVPDPRAGSWLVGYAPYVEWLGIKDNHYTTGEADGAFTSKGWASANNYGYSLISDYIEPMLRS